MSNKKECGSDELGFEKNVVNISMDRRYDVPTLLSIIERIDNKSVNGNSSLFSSGISLLKTFLGAGVISLPFAIVVFGYGFGTILLCIASIASWLGMYLYFTSTEVLGRRASPYYLAALTYPNMWYLFDLAVSLKAIGVCLSYLLLISDIMTSFFHKSGYFEDGSILYDGRVWLMFFVWIIIPLSFLKRIDHLKYSSLLGSMSIIYLLMISVYDFASSEIPELSSHIAFKAINHKSMGRFGVFIFAFTCHQNIFMIQNETKKNSPRSLSFLTGFCIALSFSFYLTYGLLSYFKYASILRDGSIFTYYPRTLPFQIARILMAILLTASYPLQVLPYRASAIRLLFNHQQQKQYPMLIHIGTSLFFIVFTFTMAFFRPSITKVLGLVGATTSSSVCYLFPSIFYLKLTSDSPMSFVKVLAVILLVFGVLVFFVCTTSAILDFILP